MTNPSTAGTSLRQGRSGTPASPFPRPRVLDGGFLSRNRGRLIGLALLIVAIVILPFVANTVVMNIAVFAAIYALPAIGLSLLMGLGGQVSLGQASFFAIGAYVHAIAMTKFGLDGILSAVLGIVAAMLVALLVGLPLLRLRGHFLAVATLGLGFILLIAVRESDFTGGTNGIYGIQRPDVFGLAIDNNGYFFWLVAPFVVIALILALNLTGSRAGRALSAVNDSEVAAESLGVNTYRLRLKTFVLSAGFAALGGVFYAYQVRIVTPDVTAFHISVEFLLMVVIGGLGSVWGAIAGAVIVEVLKEGLRDVIPMIIPGATGEVQLIGFGLVLVLVIVLLPGGLVQVFRSVAARIRRPPKSVAPPVVADDPVPDTAAFSIAHVGEEAEAAIEEAEEELGELPAVSTPVERGEVLLELAGLTKRYGGVVAVDEVSLQVRSGEITGLIGPNGAGKTTCFNMISGAIEPTSGTVAFRGQDIQGQKPHVGAQLGLTRTFQNLQVFTSTDVLGNVYMGRYRTAKAGFLRGMLGLQQREQHAELETANAVLDAMRLQEFAETPAADLPFGRQRMMEICRALALEPALLLLDEPMAGLSGHERDLLAALLRRLRDTGLTIVIVEHDVAQVMALVDRVAVLDDGKLIAYGVPAEVQSDPAVIAAYLGTDVEEAEREVEHFDEINPDTTHDDAEEQAR